MLSTPYNPLLLAAKEMSANFVSPSYRTKPSWLPRRGTWRRLRVDVTRVRDDSRSCPLDCSRCDHLEKRRVSCYRDDTSITFRSTRLITRHEVNQCTMYERKKIKRNKNAHSTRSNNFTIPLRTGSVVPEFFISILTHDREKQSVLQKYLQCGILYDV